jgi:hypothetical protein
MITTKLTHPTVKAAIQAFQDGDRAAWTALFEAGAELLDDGTPRELAAFTKEAVGHERFTSIDKVDNGGLDVVGHFHSETWGDFRTFFKFRLGASGKIARLEIGQATEVSRGTP